MWFYLKLITVCIGLYYWLLSCKDDENVYIKKIFYKYQLYVECFIFMVMSKDLKGLGPKKNRNPDEITKRDNIKRVIFLRHGESDWNNVFNKGINLGLFSRLMNAFIQEWKVFTNKDSVFIDSPLNTDGIEQALELRKYLFKTSINETDPTFELLNVIKNGKYGNSRSVIVSSCLRRAIATTVLSLWNRIENTKEKIIILNSLQEISRNIDTIALSSPNTLADLPFNRIIPHCGGDEHFIPSDIFDLNGHFGNKSIEFNGIKRLQKFNEWMFLRSEDTIIVGGHSLWFKAYFQTFLPHTCQHIAKNKKIENSGMVSFRIAMEKMADDGNYLYRIEPESIQTIYRGFTA